MRYLDSRHRVTAPVSAIMAVIAYEWLTAGIEKLSNGEFASGLPKTLASFASGTPYRWYAGFLTGFATENHALFAVAVSWGELAVGIALILAALALVVVRPARAKRWVATLAVAALVGGAFLNASFYLAAAWTSVSTRGLNVLMFWSELLLIPLVLAAASAGRDERPAGKS